MTQDQYGQTRGPGYVVHGDAVPDDENEEYGNGQSKPMTRFQKVASALRGGGPERDEEDQTAQAADPEVTPAASPWVTQQDEAAMANSPISRETRLRRRLSGRAITGTSPLRPPPNGTTRSR